MRMVFEYSSSFKCGDMIAITYERYGIRHFESGYNKKVGYVELIEAAKTTID